MCVYLIAKLEGSSITLTSFRQGLVLPPLKSKQTPKKPSQIRVKAFDKKHCSWDIMDFRQFLKTDVFLKFLVLFIVIKNVKIV